jgi:hypothetical protein
MNNDKEECRQLVIEARPLIDELESSATRATCDKLRKLLDKFMELSINLHTGREQ